MTSYSPFDKPLAELQTDDLAVLREVPESWHVEYKRQIDDPKVLAKSISALANTYGGWLFIGVEECGGGDSTVQGFPGLGSADLSALQQRLGESINAHLQPVPHYEHIVLEGPCATIGLGLDCSVVVVHVPMSVRTPHIHSDGRIYERVGDTSQPRPISERHRLDELWRRGDRVRDATRRWIEDDPEFSKGEGELLYLRLMLVPDPWSKKHRLPLASVEQFEEALNGLGPNLYSVPFDSVFSTADGFIARHVAENDPRHLGLVFTIRRDYSCDVVIPINVVTGTAESLRGALGGSYENASEFVQMLSNVGYWRDDEWMPVHVADLNPMLNVLLAIIGHYRALLGLTATDCEFFYKARILQAWRKVPFLDVAHVIKSFARHGVPMLMEDEMLIPPGHDPDSFARARPLSDEGSPLGAEFHAITGQAMDIFLQFLRSFGVSGLTDGSGSAVEGSIRSMLAAANRGVPVNFVGGVSST